MGDMNLLNSLQSPLPPVEGSSYTISVVTWTDAQTVGDSSWSNLDESLEEALTPPPIIVTIGFVLCDCETHISLTETIGPQECGHVTKIPKGMIVEHQRIPCTGQV